MHGQKTIKLNSEYTSVGRKINVQAEIIFFRKNDFIL
jgi:hypothetical protein